MTDSGDKLAEFKRESGSSRENLLEVDVMKASVADRGGKQQARR